MLRVACAEPTAKASQPKPAARRIACVHSPHTHNGERIVYTCDVQWLTEVMEHAEGSTNITIIRHTSIVVVVTKRSEFFVG